MAIRRYTREELLHLRDSPLVQKPEDLPAIEQWIEYVYVDKDSREKLRIPHSETPQPQQGRQLRSKTGGEASPMGNFSTGQRPGLMSRASKAGAGDDVSLGPPRTTFPSSRNVTKLSDLFDKAASTDTAASEDNDGGVRSRFFSERQANRKSLNEKDGPGNRESWTSIRERRAAAGEDGEGIEKSERFHGRDKDQDSERRVGQGDRFGGRWGEKRSNGDRGWRDRDRNKREPEWMSGGPSERDPEWMDDATPGDADDDLQSMGMSKRVEDFQKWKDERKLKESMNGKKAEDAVEAVSANPPPAPATLKLEGIVDRPFGSWGEPKAPANSQEGLSTSSKPAPTPAKSKGSRFASMFKDNQPKEEITPSETLNHTAAGEAVGASAEDEAGFKRILQMLGSTGMNNTPPQDSPSSPPPKTASNGSRQKSRFTGFFDQTPKSPERMQSPNFPPKGIDRPAESGDYTANRGALSNGVYEPPMSELHGQSQNANAMSSSESQENSQANREQQRQSGHLHNSALDQTLSRETPTPDLNIHNLIASQRSQKTQGPDKNSEFLLNLLQTKGSRPPSQQAHPDSNFPLWLDQAPAATEQHAPQPRAPPPPGLFEDQLLRGHPPEMLRPHQQPLQGHDVQQHQRNVQRGPPGLYDDQGLFAHQQQQQLPQRRDFPEQSQQPSRRTITHAGLPQMQMQTNLGQFNGSQQDFLQSPGGMQQGPPPGFNPHLSRHPPGFHNMPNIFPTPQPPPQGRDNGPSGPPPFPPSAGGLMNTTSPPNAPPGFFPGNAPGLPPGFMPMRSPMEGVPAGVAGMRNGGRGYDNAYDGGLGPRR